MSGAVCKDHRRRKKARAVLLALFFLCVAPTVAHAQKVVNTNKAPEKITLRQIYGAFEGSYGVIGEDQFAQAHLKLGLHWLTPLPFTESAGVIRLSMHVPLRFRTVDHPPTQSLGLRGEDWDNASELLRVLRYASVRSVDSRLKLAIGDVAGFTLGHGTILWDYHNNIAIDHYKMGAHLHINQPTWGISLMTDEVIDPHLVALRVRKNIGIPELQVGASFLTDLDAPTQLALSSEPNTSLARDEFFFPIIEQSRRAVWWGVDMQWDFFSEGLASMSQYLDINWHTGVGVGMHLGLDAGIDLGPIFLSQRLEANLSDGGYIPRYIGPLYEVDRFWFPQWGQSVPLPKLAYVSNELDQSWRVGWMSHTMLNMYLFRAEFFYAQRGADRETALIMAQLSSSVADVLQIRAAAMRHGAETIWTKQDALIFSEATAQLASFLYASARYDLRWRLGEGGTYDPTNAAFVGLGARLVFR